MKNANLVSALLLGVAVAFGVTACKEERGRAVPSATVPSSTFFPVRVGEQLVQMQLAVSPGEMSHGLMGRRDLGAQQGMIFVYERPTRMNFYMRNTPTPLDIGYFSADGVLQEVYPMYPFDETTIASRGDKLKFALEMNQGWYSQNGVRPGVAKLDLRALREALSARGFDAEVLLRTETP